MSIKNTERSDAQTGIMQKALLKHRIIPIFGEINWEVAQEFTEKIMVMSEESVSKPIRVLVNSPGGYVDAGDTIFDMIRFVRSRVMVVGLGCVASAAALIYSAPPKQDRFSLPNARYMLHQPLGGFGGSVADVKIEAKEIVKMRERLNRTFATQTGQEYERVASDSDRNFWMDSSEAMDYGLVGRLVDSMADVK